MIFSAEPDYDVARAVRALLEEGGTLNDNESGRYDWITPLGAALTAGSVGHYGMVQFLLANGADPRQKTFWNGCCGHSRAPSCAAEVREVYERRVWRVGAKCVAGKVAG